MNLLSKFKYANFFDLKEIYSLRAESRFSAKIIDKYW